ncbi:MAG: aminoglycoside phosphotransferase family protein [Oscillospiraceae bacterium]
METILETFGISGKMKSYRLITKGHINRTYLIKMEDGREYILQHINSEILQNPHAIMQNIVKITEYLQKQNIPLQIPHFYQTAKGEYLFENWRIMDKIQGITFTNTDNLEVIHSMGYAFGAFHQGLSAFPVMELSNTFPDFHNTRIRFSNLWKAVERNHFSRASLIADELQQLHEYENPACLLTDGLQAKTFPMRILHGDMKFSNILFNPENFKPIAVIDLDTLMTGTILTDYGDAVRSLMGTKLNIAKYQAFERGYLESAQFLTDVEKEYFTPSAFCMTIELATRYAEDYLNGDTYFHADSLKRLRELLGFANEFAVF